MSVSRGQIVVVTLLMIAGSGVYFFLPHPHATKDRAFPPGLLPTTHEPRMYSWKFTRDKAVDASSITLILDGQPYDLGIHRGECFELGSSAMPLTDERIAVQCASTSGGDEVGVFERDGKLLIGYASLDTSKIPYKHGDIQRLIEF